MRIRIDVHYHHDDNEDIREIKRMLHRILIQEAHMSAELDILTAQVQANEDLELSAIALIEGIAAQVAAIKDDPAKIQALADSLKASAEGLAAAITANTPAEG